MQVARLFYASDWNAGTYLLSKLDTSVNVSSFNHPALIPASALPTSFSTQTGAVFEPTATLTNTQGHGAAAWSLFSQYMLTTQAGDAASITTTADQLVFQFVGALLPGFGDRPGQGFLPGQFRNGAVASIVVDGVLLAAVDTFQAAPTYTLDLDGLSHTVQIVHSGGYNSRARPIGTITPLVGLSVSNHLAVTPLFHPTFVQASWRILATSATQYSLYKTPPGGGESLIASGLLTGTHYGTSSDIPGCDLFIPATATLTTNDSATVATDVTMLVLQSVTFGTGAVGGVAQYVTPVFDGGATAAQWYLAEWDESVALAAVSITTGNTPTPDGTWSAPLVITPRDTLLPSGRRVGMAGLFHAGTPRGQYAQLTVTFAGVSSVVRWLRDLRVYSWVPEQEPVLLGKMALPRDRSIGANLAGYAGTLVVHATVLRQSALDFAAAMSIGGATDAALAGYAAQVGYTLYTGEPPESTQVIVQAALANHAQGGSPGFMAAQLAQLVTGQNGGLATTVLTGGYTQATCQGVTVSSASGQQVQVVIPHPPYAGLPGLTLAQAQSIISQVAINILTSVGTVVTPGTPLGAANPTSTNISYT